MAENPSPMTFFSAAGKPSAVFTVAPGLSTESALEHAAAFLTSAVDLGVDGAGMSDSGRWAIVYLSEMAKALVVSALETRRETMEGGAQ
ncbi:MAG: hypothetical protein AW09_000825 [Candidatus Accumulibacter phosphatis]|uniref:DUF3077 domain-containing protein n=1 Tax=Candidatus Accumulibacter phosphatis TaxID=327160 RepID=A0A080M0R9_9PROT|nr:MAG: hypothetical protein AW09_000825 [Candidatus Accumulibacter phosphatis]HRF10996.1 DUF3077 domain-containing protein [Candidatus Accumulibacter phosphatis]